MRWRIIFIGCCWACVSVQAQEKAVPTSRDSVALRLERVLDSVLGTTATDVSVPVLKKLLKKRKKKEEPTEKNGWKSAGKYTLLFNQSAFNVDWQGGGTTNIAGNTTLAYELKYRKNSLTWDNSLLADYGLTFLKGEDFARKTNDRIELNTRLGQQIAESQWNYSLFANVRTQFAKGFRFSKDDETDETLRTEETRFFSPAFVQSGPGILWKKNDDLHVNIAPVTTRMIFVNRMFTTTPDYVDGDYFGVEAGRSARLEFGGSVAAHLKFEVLTNVSLTQLLNLYSNYIEDPANIDIDYTLSINLVVNKYISGSFVFQAIYDDNATGAFQVREIAGLGLTYTLK